MLRYFEWLLFPCLNYQSVIGQCFLFLSQGYIDNMWGADLADMHLISKFNKGFRFLLCIIDICSKYAWVVLLKDKKRYYTF